MNNSDNITKMTETGMYIGHKKSNYHPKIKKYIIERKNNVYIFDLELTNQKLEEALSFIKEILNKDQTILFVGTKIQLKDIISETAEKLQMPYVNTKWSGGFFTNFKIIKKRMDYFLKLESDVKEGKYENLIKKEQLKIGRELKKLRTKFNGVRNLIKLPEAVFVADINKNEIVVKEAKTKGIKIIAIINTNTNSELVDYPIPANNDSIKSVKYILDKIVDSKN